MTDSSSKLSFAERIKLKAHSGFDESNFKRKMPELRDKAEQVEKSAHKKQPKARFSKIPVGILKPRSGEANPNKRVVRDPRFDNASGKLNQGLFAQSYSFVREKQKDRLSELSSELRQASQLRDQDAKQRIKALIGDEKGLLPRNTSEKAL